MTQQRTGYCKRVALFTLVAGGLILPSQAAWNGAGVSGGTGGTNINDIANWTAGLSMTISAPSRRTPTSG